MENISLHTRLRALVEFNVLQVERDPEWHLSGEGAYTYKGNRIAILADYTGESPDGSGEVFAEPHDIAWSPEHNCVLAKARSVYEPFTPLTEPVRYRTPR